MDYESPYRQHSSSAQETAAAVTPKVYHRTFQRSLKSQGRGETGRRALFAQRPVRIYSERMCAMNDPPSGGLAKFPTRSVAAPDTRLCEQALRPIRLASSVSRFARLTWTVVSQFVYACASA